MLLVACAYLGLMCSWYMTGVVWFAQLVHYPLLDRGDPERFAAFARDYQRRTLWALTPALAGEIASALLLPWLWPSWQTWTGLASLALIWAWTWLWQIPAHWKLKRGFDPRVHATLVWSNFPRALLWTIRAGVMTWTTLTLP